MPSLLLRAPSPATNLTRIIRTVPTCVKHQQTTEEIHGSKQVKAYYYSDEYYSDDKYSRGPDVDNPYRYYPNPDYSDEYYSDDEYARDPDVDYADTACYQPGTSTRSLYASGAFHHDISPQPWQCQPKNSSGKSLTKQDQQNRSYPKPRKARKRHKKKHPKPSPPSPPVAGALCAQTKETHQLPDHPPIPPPWRAPMNTKRGLTRDHLQHRIKLNVPSPQRLIRPPSTHPPPSPWRAFTAGMKNKDVPPPTPTTHGHQMSRKLVKRPKPLSVLNLTQTPTSRITLIVKMYQIQHPPMPTWGHPLRRVSTQSKHAIKHQLGTSPRRT
jgi:hypothetical protein